MFYLIYYILLLPLTIYNLYFVVIGLFAFKKSKFKVKHYDPKHRLAILIAARNEESVIKNLIKSLKNQDYPDELYEIFVIPNNCSDNTEIIASKSGAKIIECKQKVKSKGEVLNYIFKYFKKKKEKYDAYVIFDADNIVDKRFLSRMNDALCEGYEVAKGLRDSKNPEDNWISGSYSIFLWSQNIFLAKAHMNMNLTTTVNGTGFMVKKSLIDRINFQATTITEDLELSVNCILNDTKIIYMDDAIFYDEHPTKFKTSWHQRERWTMGAYQCFVKFGKQLYNKMIKEKSFASFDMIMFFLAPITQVFGFILGAFLVVYELSDVSVTAMVEYLLSYRTLLILLSYLGSVIGAMFVTKYSKKSVWLTISGIIGFPIFILTWIPINMICLFKKDVKWHSVKHTRNVELDAITDKN